MDINVLKNIIEQPGSGFACPLCHTSFSISENLVRCQNGHSYNLTKPGTVNFITKKMNNHDEVFYAAELKLHQLTPWQTLLGTIKANTSVSSNICFTGSSLRPFLQDGDLGFEAAAPSVISQLRQDPASHLFIAQAASLPLGDEVMDLVIRMDQQKNMTEGLRVLKPDHFMVHILPGPKHLLEVRAHLFGGRRLGLRINQSLVKEIWSMDHSTVISQQPITLPYSVDTASLDIIIDSLDPAIDPHHRTQIHNQVSSLTFDFQVYYLKKPVCL